MTWEEALDAAQLVLDQRYRAFRQRPIERNLLDLQVGLAVYRAMAGARSDLHRAQVARAWESCRGSFEQLVDEVL